MTDEKNSGVGARPDGKTIRVLLLDDREENLLLRSTILRQKGYEVLTASSIEAAERQLAETDIAVLDYHLGAGKFGTDVAEKLRQSRPEVPIIILSATLERKFGGVEDMHLLKGYSSVDDMVAALRSFEAKKRGKPVVVDAREFYYSRISMAMGEDVVMEIMDREGNWQYVNDYFAGLFDKKREWFFGKNLFQQFPEMGEEWRENIRTVADTRETYIDRSFRGVPHLPETRSSRTWNLIMFPLKLHNGHPGVVLSARIIERK
ncbi:MAG: response regulator [Acidobacteriales bacterium]|nr:response regulator [Terriglobales bacterium]